MKLLDKFIMSLNNLLKNVRYLGKFLREQGEKVEKRNFKVDSHNINDSSSSVTQHGGLEQITNSRLFLLTDKVSNFKRHTH